MIDQKDVISFFDRCAPGWDAEMIRNEPVIRTILDNAGIRAGVDVLDVACGTAYSSQTIWARTCTASPVWTLPRNGPARRRKVPGCARDRALRRH